MKHIRRTEINYSVCAFVIALGLTGGAVLLPQTVLAQQNTPQPNEKSAPGATMTPEQRAPESNSQLGAGDDDEHDIPGCRYDRQDLQLLV